MSYKTDSLNTVIPLWHRIVLIACCIHSGTWGVFIVAFPKASGAVYGFAEPPHELHLWQGAGLFISLLAVGYGIAATNPRQHWAVVFIGLLAKVLGAGGMCFSVYQQQVSPAVLWLLPLNDVIWWWPFLSIVRAGLNAENSSYFRAEPI